MVKISYRYVKGRTLFMDYIFMIPGAKKECFKKKILHQVLPCCCSFSSRFECTEWVFELVNTLYEGRWPVWYGG